jgi:hypothetical protein
MVVRAALVAVLLAACTGTPPPAHVVTGAAGSSTVVAEQADPQVPPPPPLPAVFRAACATECADDLAEVVTYRDAAGDLAIVTVQGSPERCSHPPLRFLGPDGAERAVIPMQPVVPGSDEARRFDAIRTQQIGALTKAETLFCQDVTR